MKGQGRNQQPSFCLGLWKQHHHQGCWELCLPSGWGLTWLPGVWQLLQPPAFSLQLASFEQKQPNKSFRRLAMKMPPQQVELYRAHLFSMQAMCLSLCSYCICSLVLLAACLSSFQDVYQDRPQRKPEQTQRQIRRQWSLCLARPPDTDVWTGACKCVEH